MSVPKAIYNSKLSLSESQWCFMYNRKTHPRDFPGGPVVMNPSANAGDMNLIPDFGNISQMLWKN